MKAFSLANACSIGLKSGLYGGGVRRQEPQLGTDLCDRPAHRRLFVDGEVCPAPPRRPAAASAPAEAFVYLRNRPLRELSRLGAGYSLTHAPSGAGAEDYVMMVAPGHAGKERGSIRP